MGSGFQNLRQGEYAVLANSMAASVSWASRHQRGELGQITVRSSGFQARSSVVEHYRDMVGVAGSIPVAPTIISKDYLIFLIFFDVYEPALLKLRPGVSSQ